MDRLKERDPEKYKHLILGGWKEKAEGVIFTNWMQDPFVWNGDHIGIGIDFGFSNDPTAATLINIDTKSKRIYLKQLIYRTGLTTSEISEKLKDKVKRLDKMLLIGDSAEPRLIHELRTNHKINIKPSIKGQGSIMAGIALMQDYQLVVDPSSKDIVRELNNYVFKDDKEVPIDDWNHALDGIRYFVAYHLTKARGQYFIG